MSSQPAIITYLCRKRGTVDRQVLLRYDLHDEHYMVVNEETYRDLDVGMTVYICGFPIRVIDKPSSRIKSVSDRFRVYVSHFPSFSECFG